MASAGRGRREEHTASARQQSVGVGSAAEPGIRRRVEIEHQVRLDKRL
jgi:hypothetical protein